MGHLLRRRHGQEHARFTFVELFFDLVFVFAVTRLSHALLAPFSVWEPVPPEELRKTHPA